MPLPVVQSHMRIDELERHWLELFEEDVVVLVALKLRMTYEHNFPATAFIFLKFV